MSDQKPMKHEEYLAMGEENRRLTEEVEKLRSVHAKLSREKRRRFARRVFELAKTAAPGLVVILGAGGVVGLMCLVFPKADPNARKTPCYFVRHHRELHEDRDSSPWEPWHIFKSESEGGSNSFVTNNGRYGDPIKFDSKQAAWDFMMRWKLEACK